MVLCLLAFAPYALGNVMFPFSFTITFLQGCHQLWPEINKSSSYHFKKN